MRLSEVTLNYFLRYLKATENPTLLQVGIHNAVMCISTPNWCYILGHTTDLYLNNCVSAEWKLNSNNKHNEAKKTIFLLGVNITFFHFLQIFNTYIEVEVDESGAGSSGAVFRTPDTHAGAANGLVNGYTPESMTSETMTTSADGMDCTQEELQKVKDAIARLKSAQPVPPSLCVYSVSNAYNGLSCACVNSDGSLLSCGFEDSVIKLWKLTAPVHNVGFRKKTFTVGPRGGVSHTLLACDASRIEDDGDGGEEEEEAAADARNGGRRRNRGGELFALRGHQGPVMDTCFTHDSSHLLSVSEDTTMRLWSLENGQGVALYRGHTYPVWCVTASPLTMHVATGSYDTTARIWATDYTYPLRTLAGHTQSVDCLAFHSNGTYLATGSCDRTVRLWQVMDGDVARVLVQHKAPVSALAFSPNGK